MVARLKLKDIDGRAPPGVSIADSAPRAALLQERGGHVLLASEPKPASVRVRGLYTYPAGNLRKRRNTPLAAERCEHSNSFLRSQGVIRSRPPTAIAMGVGSEIRSV